MIRTELETNLHRTANFVECRLSEIIPELLAESGIRAVSSVSWAATGLVEALRRERDGEEVIEV